MIPSHDTMVVFSLSTRQNRIMDFKSSINFIAENYVIVTGSTLALFFATSMVLLIRSIGKKEEAQAATLDVKEIEVAMQRVLAAQPIAVAAAPAPAIVDAETIEEESNERSAAPASEANQEVIDGYKKTISELESRVEQLTKDLETAKSQEKPRDENAVSKEEYDALKEKVSELQARLTEYEIIEDDIADLSMYKEENARLKAELARMKGTPEGEQQPPQVVKAAPKPDHFELDVNDSIMKEFATAVEIRNAPPAEAQSSLPSDLVNEEILTEAPASATETTGQAEAAAPSEEAAAVTEVAGAIADEFLKAAEELETDQGGNAGASAEAAQNADAAPGAEASSESTEANKVAKVAAAPEADTSADAADILNAALDTEKILSEAASIEGKGGDIGDVLSESLDTDKLLAEMNSLSTGSESKES